MSIYLLSNIITLYLLGDTYYHLRTPYSLEDEKETCYSCHTSLVLNKKNFLPVIQERQSVHFKNKVFCTDCHRQEKFLIKRSNKKRDKIFSSCPFYKKLKREHHSINELCGVCHKKIFDDFLSGVHKNKLDCVYCHSNHGINKPTLDIIRPERCATCHRYPDIAPVKDEFRKAESILISTEAFLDKKKSELPLDIYQKYSQKIKLARDNMRSQRHRFIRQEISSNSNYILLLSGHIRKEVNSELERMKIKKYINIGIWLIIMLAITGVLYYLYHYYRWRKMLEKNNFIKE
ncbi:MAG: hypothetical protein N2746_06535 [Deltaproteobacteria bacterium]|nr:hypothetical protein [Deltaproteobacteria bacterium]